MNIKPEWRDIILADFIVGRGAVLVHNSPSLLCASARLLSTGIKTKYWSIKHSNNDLIISQRDCSYSIYRTPGILLGIAPEPLTTQVPKTGFRRCEKMQHISIRWCRSTISFGRRPTQIKKGQKTAPGYLFSTWVLAVNIKARKSLRNAWPMIETGRSLAQIIASSNATVGLN